MTRMRTEEVVEAKVKGGRRRRTEGEEKREEERSRKERRQVEMEGRGSRGEEEVIDEIGVEVDREEESGERVVLECEMKVAEKWRRELERERGGGWVIRRGKQSDGSGGTGKKEGRKEREEEADKGGER